MTVAGRKRQLYANRTAAYRRGDVDERGAKRHSTPRRRGSRHIGVRGDQRKDVDMERLARVLIALGRTLEDERQFLEELQQHDERVGIATFLPLRTHVGVLAGRVFVLFDGERLVCRMPEDVVDELIAQPGYEPWRDPVTNQVIAGYVRLPKTVDRTGRLHHGLAALGHANVMMSAEAEDSGTNPA